MVITVLLAALQLYSILFVVRALMSWFPIRSDSVVAPLHRFIFQVTEPVLGPVRSVMPRVGMFDISIIVVLIGISILRTMLYNLA